MGRVIRESSAHPSNYGRIPADGRLLGCVEMEGSGRRGGEGPAGRGWGGRRGKREKGEKRRDTEG